MAVRLMDECIHLMERSECVNCNGYAKRKAEEKARLRKPRGIKAFFETLEVDEVPWPAA